MFAAVIHDHWRGVVCWLTHLLSQARGLTWGRAHLDPCISIPLCDSLGDIDGIFHDKQGPAIIQSCSISKGRLTEDL